MCNCQVVIRIFVTFDNLIFRPEKMTQISEKEAGTEVIQLNQYTDEVMGGVYPLSTYPAPTGWETEHICIFS